MTTLHAYTQHSDIFESTLLHDYETVSTLELASYPETSEDVDFKSSLRQRSYDRAQKKQARDSRIIHNDDSEEEQGDINERIRFKRNLTFKTDDDGIMASTRVDSRLWKQVFVQKLDEKDQARERKRDSRSNKKQGGKHQGIHL
ncbi:hypothetical protein BGZ72_008439 [Mortierella alpina]|nr:hypothetical protein BGZ72_008439 [Mortierella alpina]